MLNSESSSACGDREPRPLVIVCAPDSFKGSLSAAEAAEAMARGIGEAAGRVRVETRRAPLADGGEGTVEAIVRAAGGEFVDTEVVGPVGERVRARWGVIDGGRTAVIEMAAAAGLPLVPRAMRNPLRTTTFGVGQLIRAALDRPGVERILVGVGGSATCDGGLGMAQALGARAEHEDNGRPLREEYRTNRTYATYATDGTDRREGADAKERPDRTGKEGRGGADESSEHGRYLSGGDLVGLKALDCSRIDPRLFQREIEVLCDVTNPLLGPSGAAAVFAPQKGASPKDVETLERGLTNLVRLWRDALLGGGRVLRPGGGAEGGSSLAGQPGSGSETGRGDLAALPGGGAAGGLAAGLVAFCGARIVPGIDRILDAVRFDETIRGADLVLTGEGAFNRQSLSGKVVSGVAKRCRAAGLPLVVVAGSVDAALGPDDLDGLGVAAAFSLVDGPCAEEDAMARAAALLARQAGSVARLFLAGRLSR